MSSFCTFAEYTRSINFFGPHTPNGLAARFGSPLYIYNESILRARCREMKSLSDLPNFHVHYSAKANANPALLKIIRSEGLRVDAMSPGELFLEEQAGFTPEEIIYICNNVSTEELRLPLDKGLLVGVDSLSQLDALGRLNPGGRAMIRFNPGIGAGHHQKVITAGAHTKFGIGRGDLPALREILKRHKLTLVGLNQHIGSLFMEPHGYLEAMDVLLEVAEEFLPGLTVVDFGGGFGIPYHKYDAQPRLDIKLLAQGFHKRITDWADKHNYSGRFLIEPGRYVVAESGLLLGTVAATKNNGPIRFVGTDLGFNVLARPVLYDSYHDIEIYREGAPDKMEGMPQTLVGNICESGDILARERLLPELKEGDLLGALDAGAYGYAMSFPYTQRLRPAEVLIDLNGDARLIRRRETVEDLLSLVP